MAEKKSVLFVCMGNICRSPAAEGVFQHMVDERGLSDRFEIDSAGTIGFHAGDLADPRMRQTAEQRGIDLQSRARQFVPRDFERFDMILVADRDNLSDVLSQTSKKRHAAKVKLLTDFHPDESVTHVPDPYYGGPEGFERVLDILDVACDNLLTHMMDGAEE